MFHNKTTHSIIFRLQLYCSFKRDPYKLNSRTQEDLTTSVPFPLKYKSPKLPKEHIAYLKSKSFTLKKDAVFMVFVVSMTTVVVDVVGTTVVFEP